MAENTLTNVTNPQPRAEETRNGNFFTPRVDIVETENALYLYADMPGVRPDNIDLRYENGELILRGHALPEQRPGHVVFGEFERGDFYRVFQLHESIDASQIEAEHKNGVLTVRLPKQEAVKPKQVQIRTQA
jgi:HSP20 family protein